MYRSSQPYVLQSRARGVYRVQSLLARKSFSSLPYNLDKPEARAPVLIIVLPKLAGGERERERGGGGERERERERETMLDLDSDGSLAGAAQL
jgi:hypothetical protein